ncbi:MAG: hypothetical protein IH616_05045 [Gemmatimonadales bacterium]|nr:hypothetical protein [Gemmatimonadales bacterium]
MSIPRSGKRRSGLLVVALLLTGPGCFYGFAGGGLPSHIKTVAILPFDNQTPEPALIQEVADAVTEAMERRLGLRLSSEESADAVVRGTIVRYDPDLLLSQQPGVGEVQVTRRRVRLVLNVEIYDQREGKTLWQRSSLAIDGEYTPPLEAEGRRVAMEKLVADIVDGAQSQW